MDGNEKNRKGREGLVVVSLRTGETMMLKMEPTIERAWELESRGDVPEDCDYHNSLTLLPRAHRGSDQPLNKVVDGKKPRLIFSVKVFC